MKTALIALQLWKGSMMTKLTLPPSAADRWVYCAGSAALEKVYGVFTPSTYALEGTRAHKVAACLIKGEKVPIEDWVTDEMYQCGDLYWDFIDSIRKSGLVLSELAEERLDTGRSFGTSLPSKGDVDYAALVRTDEGLVLWVVDYKYGKGVPVSPYQNYQLLSYLSAVLNKWEVVGRRGIKVNLCIHQPRIYDEPLIWSSMLEDLNPFLFKLKISAEDTGACFKRIVILPTNPSKSNCQFCSGRIKCKRLRMDLNDIFAAYNLEGFNGDPQLINDLVASSDMEDLTAVLDKIEALQHLKKAIIERIESTINAGGKVPGWGFGSPTLGNRKYANEFEILSYLRVGLEKGSLPFGVIEEKPLSPADLLKLVGKKQYPHAREEIESMIIRDTKLGTIQRVYNDPTLDAISDTSALPTRPEGE